MIRWIGVWLVVLAFALSGTIPAFAAGRGKGNPPGWSKGEKKGWKGESEPPGFSKRGEKSKKDDDDDDEKGKKGKKGKKNKDKKSKRGKKEKDDDDDEKKENLIEDIPHHSKNFYNWVVDVTYFEEFINSDIKSEAKL